MPFPNIGGRKKLYRQYLRYSNYDRVKHAKYLKNWLSVKSTELSGTATAYPFSVDTSMPGAEVFERRHFEFSTGDGPFMIERNSTFGVASLTLTVASQPSVGDEIYVTTTGLPATLTFIASGGTPNASQIALGTSAALTAANIRAKLDTDIRFIVTGTGTSVIVTANSGGPGPNDYSITSSTTAITGGGNLSGGADPILTEPLRTDALYFIHSVPTTGTFLLTLTPGGAPIRPIAAGSGEDFLVPATSTGAIFELLRLYTSRVIAAADDVDDLTD